MMPSFEPGHCLKQTVQHDDLFWRCLSTHRAQLARILLLTVVGKEWRMLCRARVRRCMCQAAGGTRC